MPSKTEVKPVLSEMLLMKNLFSQENGQRCITLCLGECCSKVTSSESGTEMHKAHCTVGWIWTDPTIKMVVRVTDVMTS